MKIWAIGDLHLSFGVPNKSMSIFGDAWKNYEERVQKSWDSLVSSEDLVLIPGDISWAMKLEDAMPDLLWIDQRPGHKVIIRGNHDMWWNSISQLRKALPPSIEAIQNDTVTWKNRVYIAGARLWDSDEYSFDNWIERTPRISEKTESMTPRELKEENQRIFSRELIRLEESLKKLPTLAPEGAIKIAMTHYPPIGPETMNPSLACQLLKKYGVSKVVFGHLHSLKKSLRSQEPLFPPRDNLEFFLTSCDWLDCKPLLIYDTNR